MQLRGKPSAATAAIRAPCSGAQTSRLNSSIDKAIANQQIDALREFAHTKSDSAVLRDIGFRVVYYAVSDDRHSVTYRWASPYVAERVAEVLQSAHVTRVQ